MNFKKFMKLEKKSLRINEKKEKTENLKTGRKTSKQENKIKIMHCFSSLYISHKKQKRKWSYPYAYTLSGYDMWKVPITLYTFSEGVVPKRDSLLSYTCTKLDKTISIYHIYIISVVQLLLIRILHGQACLTLRSIIWLPASGLPQVFPRSYLHSPSNSACFFSSDVLLCSLKWMQVSLCSTGFTGLAHSAT